LKLDTNCALHFVRCVFVFCPNQTLRLSFLIFYPFLLFYIISPAYYFIYFITSKIFAVLYRKEDGTA